MKKTVITLIAGLFVLGFSTMAFGQNAWINEIHYDNVSTDEDEMVEVVIEDAGSYTLSDFTVTLYNGNNGAPYGTHTLDTFTQGTTSDNFTFYYKYISGIQNGAPDGLALDYQATVIQFLSYEGTFTAVGGPADGMESIDIGVEEGSSTPVGHSLQLAGSGTQYSDFTWQPPAPATPGDLNNAQSFGGPPIMTKAYSISSTAIDVFYNQDMTSVNPADYTLTGTATITFSSATIDGTNPKLIHLTGASTDMIGDIILDNIYDAANDTDFDFYAGITPIALTNTLNPDGHIDNTHLATFQGIVSANDAYNNVWVSDAPGPYNGVLIFDYDFQALVEVGDEILFTANRTEYYNLTELGNPTLLEIISTGNTPHGPTDIAGSDIDQNIPADTNPAEQWEGQLVSINNVLVDSLVAKEDLYIGSDDNWATSFIIGDNVDYQYANIGPLLDDAVASGEPINLVGVVDFSYGKYRINPRFTEDLPVEEYPAQIITILSQNTPNPLTNSTMISFNLAPLKNKQNASLSIYNTRGQLVREFPLDDIQGEILWDRTDNYGNKVGSGIYMYKLSTTSDSFIRKMVVLD
jgi:hypothetical protein